jgi:acetolactate synthase I/II/III large subunit
MHAVQPPQPRRSRERTQSFIRELSLVEETAAERMIGMLVRLGVCDFFGVPGGPAAPIFEAIGKTPGARLVESRHETSAGFSAASYWRMSGQVPAVVVTAGPGITNGVTGIASAHVEGVPMIVLCGDVSWARRGERLLQNTGPEGVSAEGMLGHMTRGTFRIPSAESGVAQVVAAFERATDSRNPGPVLVVVPNDRAAATVAAQRVEVAPVRDVQVPSQAVAREIAMALSSARRPLVVLGAGARPFATQIRRMLDGFNVPFVTTPQGKGIVSERHPRSLRTAGLAASMWAREYTRAGVDVALVLGTDLDDVSIGPTPYVGKGGRLYHVDRDPTVFHRNLPTHAGIASDLAAFLEVFEREATSIGAIEGDATKFLRHVRRSSPFDHPTASRDASIPIRPDSAVLALQRVAPKNTIFISDIGEHMLFAMHYLTAEHEQHFHIHLGLGSMGSGIAGAVGLGLADPTRPIVCICGDGGMQMNGMELLVAKQLDLPILYAVFNDARYNMVYHGMTQLFGRSQSWETPFVDFAGWARSMKIPAVTVDRAEQLTPDFVSKLLHSGGPSLLDIRIDREVRIRGGGRVEALQQMQAMESPR